MTIRKLRVRPQPTVQESEKPGEKILFFFLLDLFLILKAEFSSTMIDEETV